jgi:hypothetical protein
LEGHTASIFSAEDVRILGYGLKMKAVHSSDVLLSTCKSTRRYNPEDKYRHHHCRENLKSHVEMLYLQNSMSRDGIIQKVFRG